MSARETRRKQRARHRRQLEKALDLFASDFRHPVAFLGIGFQGSAASWVFTNGLIGSEDIEAIIARAEQRRRGEGPSPWDVLLDLHVPPALLAATPAGQVPNPDVLKVAVTALVERAADLGDPAWGTRVLGKLIGRWMPVFEVTRFRVILSAIEALGEQATAVAQEAFQGLMTPEQVDRWKAAVDRAAADGNDPAPLDVIRDAGDTPLAMLETAAARMLAAARHGSLETLNAWCGLAAMARAVDRQPETHDALLAVLDELGAIARHHRTTRKAG